MRVVIHDALGFAFESATLDCVGLVEVTPSLLPTTLRRWGHGLAALVQGVTPVRRRGYGTEFRSLRPYQPTDDYRTIAWRRSRPGAYVVREFEQESQQDFVLVLSLADTMRSGEVGRTAFDRAAEAAVLFAYRLPRRGDRVGLFLPAAGRPEVYLPPSSDPGQRLRIETALVHADPTAAGFPLGVVLDRLAAQLRAPAHVLAFGLPDPPFEDLLERYRAFLRRGHRLFLFLPMLPAFYPPLASPEARELHRLSQIRWEAEFAEERHVLRSAHLPAFPYDPTNLTARLLAVYRGLAGAQRS